MNNFTIKEKYAIINVLTHIMKADGVVHPKEEEYMNQMYFDFGITINDLEKISNIDEIQTKLIISGMDKENKDEARLLFIGMAESDGFIHPKEIEIINQLFLW